VWKKDNSVVRLDLVRDRQWNKEMKFRTEKIEWDLKIVTKDRRTLKNYEI
jgi:hypothetical protein